MEHILSKTENGIQLTETMVKRGWSVSPYGAVLVASAVDGYLASTPAMRYSAEPNVSLLNGAGNYPVVTSRFTPEDQRGAHLNKLIGVLDQGQVPFRRIIAGVASQNNAQMNVAIDDIPMIDCIVGLPLLGDKTHFAGGIDVSGKNGLALVTDRGMWNRSLWVTPKEKITFGLSLRSLPVATSTDAGEVQVFTVEGILEAEALGAESLMQNCVSAFTLVSDVQKPKSLMIDSGLAGQFEDYMHGQGMRGGSLSFGGGGFGKMGESAKTGAFADEGKVSDDLKYPLIINFYPFVMSQELPAGNRIKQLAASLD